MDDLALILEKLEWVAKERRGRESTPGLVERVQAVKAFQHRRFAHTYADLLASPQYAPAASFFLDELYGPFDFTRRDQQFERVAPALSKMLPRELVGTLARLAELHALSEELDTCMGHALRCAAIDARSYTQAWCRVGMPAWRERQIALTVSVGRALERYTHSRMLRAALHAMRRPAKIAGLGDLQRFLEIGFDTFKDIADPNWFIDEIGRREREFASRLFAMDDSGIAKSHLRRDRET